MQARLGPLNELATKLVSKTHSVISNAVKVRRFHITLVIAAHHLGSMVIGHYIHDVVRFLLLSFLLEAHDDKDATAVMPVKEKVILNCRLFIFINLNKQRINIRKDTSYVIVSCLEMTILYPRMSRNRLQTRKTDAKRRCALHPKKSNKDLLNKAFYHVFLISITIIIITIIKSRIGIYSSFRTGSNKFFFRKFSSFKFPSLKIRSPQFPFPLGLLATDS